MERKGGQEKYRSRISIAQASRKHTPGLFVSRYNLACEREIHRLKSANGIGVREKGCGPSGGYLWEKYQLKDTHPSKHFFERNAKSPKLFHKYQQCSPQSGEQS